jgi:hypothetical protein
MCCGHKYDVHNTFRFYIHIGTAYFDSSSTIISEGVVLQKKKENGSVRMEGKEEED